MAFHLTNGMRYGVPFDRLKHRSSNENFRTFYVCSVRPALYNINNAIQNIILSKMIIIVSILYINKNYVKSAIRWFRESTQKQPS